MDDSKRKTLGRNVLPISYDLLIDTDLKTFRFECTERIDVLISKPSNKIKVHSKDLKIKSASISHNRNNYKARITYQEKDQTIELTTSKKLSGKASINLNFIGANDDSMYGFYRSTYKVNGKSEYMLTSQFEPVSARKAFVCFDEPEFKATFNVSFLIDKKLTALSNMPETSNEDIGKGRRLVTFRTTPKMSTYLLYFGVGKFDMLEERVKNRIYRIITVPGKKDYTQMPMDFTKKFMNYLESYFKIKYPLPKMDIIGIPDFAAGAMENWGAITGRETQMLGKKGATSVAVERSLAVTISHELAHQWFGDLVTMAWWDDIWLNESFATFMETKAVDKVYPEWKMRIDDKVGSMGSALFFDQLKSTHKINVEVNDPDEIDSIFDSISYEKGCCVLEMLEDYIGETAFRNGLHSYLKKHAYSNAVKDDLWNSLKGPSGSAAKLPKVARFWINTPGYPIVDVEGPKNGVISLRQRRFSLLPSKEDKNVWPIPLHYLTDKGSGFILMDSKTAKIKVGDAKFIKLNPGEKGFYRVSYQKENIEKLGRVIAEKKLDPLDAWGVERDLVTLARIGKIKVMELLDFIEKYCKDCEYPLNMSVISQLDGIVSLFSGNKKIEGRAKKMSIEFNRKILSKVGWVRIKGEHRITTLLRSMAIRSLGFNGDKNTAEKVREIFKRYLDSGTDIDTNLKGSIYRIVALNGDEKTFDKLLELYKKSGGGEEALKLLGALGCFKNERLLLRALNLSLTDEVRLQNKQYIAGNASSTIIGRRIILKWTFQNWKKLKGLYKESGRSINDFISNLSVTDTKADKLEIERFFNSKENYVKVADRELKNTLEIIESNIRYLRNNQ